MIRLLLLICASLLVLVLFGCSSSGATVSEPDWVADSASDLLSKTDPDVGPYDLNEEFDSEEPAACNVNLSRCVAWYCDCGVCTPDRVRCVRKSWALTQGCPISCEVICPDLALIPCHCSAGSCMPL